MFFILWIWDNRMSRWERNVELLKTNAGREGEVGEDRKEFEHESVGVRCEVGQTRQRDREGHDGGRE